MVPRYVVDLKSGVSDAPLRGFGLDLAHTPESSTDAVDSKSRSALSQLWTWLTLSE
jgi:hypothetical protein